MKQGISIERTYDLHDRLIVRILKRRGRLTLEEVSDLLRLEGGGEWSGWYAVLLNCTEGTIGGNGLYDSDDPKGDAVDLYEINEGDDCPICGKFIPALPVLPELRSEVERRRPERRDAPRLYDGGDPAHDRRLLQGGWPSRVVLVVHRLPRYGPPARTHNRGTPPRAL